jgi:hypothetical protein
MHMNKDDATIKQEINNPFAKRNGEQRNRDREFIKIILQDDPSISKLQVHHLLNKYIKDRGDQYSLSYDFVTEEVSNIKKKLVKDSGIDISAEIIRSLDLIEENIKLCLIEIQVRFQEREEVTEIEEDLTFTDFAGMTTEQKSNFNEVRDKFKKLTIKKKTIRAGSNINEAMRLLEMWIKAKRELLGLDAPKRVEKKTKNEHSIENSTKEELESTLRILGFSDEKIKKLKDLISNPN